MCMDFDYIVADPTGNITVLITSPYTAETRQDMIRESFAKEPSCEQVGFIMPVSEDQIRLEMMGYEFCGNATLSAAAWQAGSSGLAKGCESIITVHSSGTDSPLRVRVRRLEGADDSPENDSIYGRPGFEGTVSMPVPSVTSFNGWPLVKVEGISHMLVPSDAFTDDEAEQAVREYANELDVPALGMMLCPDYDSLTSQAPEVCDLTIRPLVYVPGSETTFWEQGCATGSTAVGWYRYSTCGSTHTAIKQPGGIISVDIAYGQPMLTGKVIFRPGI